MAVYNREALNRIASQDRLDNMIILVSPVTWISIVGAFLIVIALVIWGFLGKLPSSTDTTGVYTTSDGMGQLFSQSEGFVTHLYVEDGQAVKKGDLIATLGTEDDIFNIRQIDQRISYVENMTFESELDEVTSDTQKMASIKLSAKTANTDARKTSANLELKKEKLADLKKQVEEKEQIMLNYKEEFFKTLSITDQKEQVEYTEANADYDKHFSLYEQYKSTYINAKEAFYTKKGSFDEKYSEYDYTARSEDENAVYNAALAELMAAETQAADAKYFMEEEEKKVKEANSNLDAKRKIYLEYLNQISGTAADNTMASTEYTEALQEYTTSKNQYKALSDEIDNLELQAVLDEDTAELNVDTYRQQFDNEKSIVLHDLNSQRDLLLNKEEKGNIYATQDCQIYDVLIADGSAVSKGSEVAKLVYGNQDNDIVLCYVKLSDAKKIEKGMEAHIFPSTVDREEYGHILGKVIDVSNHVASATDMISQLGEQSLVNEFAAQGAVMEITVKLDYDPTTKSGYKWSSEKGSDVKLSSGTMVAVTVITENKRPIDILIPYIKSKLEFESEDEKNANK